jgi:hypothetical protein
MEIDLDRIGGERDEGYLVDVLSVEDAKEWYPCVWKTAKRMFPDLADEEVVKIVSLVTDTCSHCYMTQKGCQCWNDE